MEALDNAREERLEGESHFVPPKAAILSKLVVNVDEATLGAVSVICCWFGCQTHIFKQQWDELPHPPRLYNKHKQAIKQTSALVTQQLKHFLIP